MTPLPVPRLVTQQMFFNLRMLAVVVVLLPLWLVVLNLLHVDTDGGVTPLVALMLIVIDLFALDENTRENVLYASLPNARRTILRTRYVVLWLYFIVLPAYLELFNTCSARWFRGRDIAAGTIADFPMHLLSVVIMMLFIVPFLIRYGRNGGLLIGIGWFGGIVLLIVFFHALLTVFSI